MSARAHPTLVGAFVVGGIFLGVLGILTFGGGKFFNRQEKFITYFSDSVNGLSKGSAVKFKGVQIGQVTDILIRFDQAEDNDSIPVIIEIDVTNLRNKLGVNIDLSDDIEFQKQIQQGGLRARLQLQSFVTGQLYIELDYTQDPPRPPVELSKIYKEIPSTPSNLSEVMKSVTTALQNISAINFQEIAGKVNLLLDQINQGVKDINFKDINDSLVAALRNLNVILEDPRLRDIAAKAGVTLDDIDRLALTLNQQVQPISTELQATAQKTRTTLDQMDKTLEAVRGLVAPDSSLHYELDKALTEITSAARALRLLADYLQNNPSAVIFGKPPQATTVEKNVAPPAAPNNPPPANNPAAAPAN